VKYGFYLILSLLLFSACSNDSTLNPQIKLKSDLYQLAFKNGCIDCHRANATVVGPSWQAIAERYASAPIEAIKPQLVKSVLDGSKGNWLTWKGGDGMPPMRNRVSNEHIEQLVEYILLLKRVDAKR